MNEVKSPKKPLLYYYFVVVIILMLFNMLAMPWMAEHQIKRFIGNNSDIRIKRVLFLNFFADFYQFVIHAQLAVTPVFRVIIITCAGERILADSHNICRE